MGLICENEAYDQAKRGRHGRAVVNSVRFGADTLTKAHDCIVRRCPISCKIVRVTLVARKLNFQVNLQASKKHFQ